MGDAARWCCWRPARLSPTVRSGPAPRHLTDAFTARGIDARWVVWDDPDVDWSEGLVAVRSTWDYETRLRGVPGLGALGAADAELGRGLRLEHGQGLPDRAGGDRRSRRADAGRRGRGGAAGSHRRGLGRRPGQRGGQAAGGRGRPRGRGLRLDRRRPGRPRRVRSSGPAPGWCSRWWSRCGPRGRPPCSCSTATWSRRRRSVPAAGEIRVHEAYGGTTVAGPALGGVGRAGPSYGRGGRRHPRQHRSTTPGSTRCAWPTAPWP